VNIRFDGGLVAAKDSANLSCRMMDLVSNLGSDIVVATVLQVNLMGFLLVLPSLELLWFHQYHHLMVLSQQI
jgi:hypothetical protein